MKLRLPTLVLLVCIASLDGVTAADPAAGSASRAESTGGEWQSLFDGTSLKGWHGLGLDPAEPPPTWTVADGCIRCLGGYKGAVDLATNDEYENFEFAFEWRFPKTKGNSGVKYRVREQPGKGYAFGCEYQIMNDPDATDRHASGSLYDLFAPQGKKLVPPGEFNQSRIVVRGNRLEHWLNGVRVVTAEFGSDAMQAALAKSYFKKSDWGKHPRGRIALQNHHSEVLFRNLKIRVVAAESN